MECQYCDMQDEFALVMRKALYEKYSSSQNYTYIRIVNDLIFARRSHVTTIFKDYLFWDYEEEYMETYISNPLKELQTVVHQKAHNGRARIFHSQVAHTIDLYNDAHLALNYMMTQKQKKMQTCSVSKILKTSILDMINNNNNRPSSTQGSIVFIKNQLNDIVSNQSYPQNQNESLKFELCKQLRQIYSRFTQRRIQKKMRSQRRSHDSIDKQTQTYEQRNFIQQQYVVPIIQPQDKLFLQKIIRQQKEKERGPLLRKYQNKLANSQQKICKTHRSRNSVEIHNNRYITAFQSSNVSTARISTTRIGGSNQKTTRQNSTYKQQRTKSQSYDSNNITKALENKIQYCSALSDKKEFPKKYR